MHHWTQSIQRQIVCSHPKNLILQQQKYPFSQWYSSCGMINFLCVKLHSNLLRTLHHKVFKNVMQAFDSSSINSPQGFISSGMRYVFRWLIFAFVTLHFPVHRLGMIVSIVFQVRLLFRPSLCDKTRIYSMT